MKNAAKTFADRVRASVFCHKVKHWPLSFPKTLKPVFLHGIFWVKADCSFMHWVWGDSGARVLWCFFGFQFSDVSSRTQTHVLYVPS